MKLISNLLILIILVMGISFAALNSGMVVFHYYFGSRQISLALLLVITFGVGIFLTLLFMSIVVLRLKHEKHKLRKQLKATRQEVDNLRTMPIKEMQ